MNLFRVHLEYEADWTVCEAVLVLMAEPDATGPEDFRIKDHLQALGISQDRVNKIEELAG